MIRRRVLTGTLSNAAGKAISVGVWFILTPFVLHQLGASGYGLWVLVGAVASYGSLLDLGIGSAVVKYVAEHAARGEWDAARVLLATAQWLYLGLGIIAFGLGLLLAPVFPHLIGVASGDRETAAWLIVLTGANVGFAIALTPARSALQGLQRYDLCNLVSTAGTLAGAAFTVAALLAGFGVIGMVAASIAMTIAMGLASRQWTRRVAPDLDFRWRGATRAMMRRITSFSASVFALQIGGRLQTKTDEVVIALFRPIEAVTPYALARKLGEVAQLGAVQFLNVLMPLASELDARDDRHQLRTLYIVASRVTLGIAAPVAIVLVLLGGPILALWVGRAYAGYGNLVAVIATSSLIGISQWPAGAVLQGMARHGILAATSLGAGAVNIALSLALLPVFGLMGVALGTLIPTIVGSLFVILPVTNRILDVPLRTTLRDVWAPGLLPAVPAAGAVWIASGHVGSSSVVSLAAATVLAGIVYAAGYLSMPASAMERQFVRDIVTTFNPEHRHARTDGARHSYRQPRVP
jgi:O-antigen/teichoic acid export membrane protein